MAAPWFCSGRLVGTLAERPGPGQLADRFRHILPLAPEIVAHRAAQRWIGDVVRRVSRLRQVTAGDLVLALRAGLDPAQAALDGKVDRLIVADLEMQERVVLDGAPVAAEQGVRADTVDG